MFEGDVAQTPVLMGGPVVEGALNNACTHGSRNFLGTISATRVIDDDVIAPAYGFQATRQISLFIFCQNKN
jgi:hypothetical protein